MYKFVPLLLVLAGCQDLDGRAAGREKSFAATRTTIDEAALDSAVARASALPRMRSLLISWRDSTVREQYFGNARADRRANIKSASKSVISALIGIAIAEGAIDSLGQTIGELLPRETRGLDAAKRAITVRDLLSMQAGLQPTSFDNYGSWVGSSNWVRNALERPLIDSPGGRMLYSTGSTHLLSAILTRSTGVSTYEYARRKLAVPLGISLRPWQRDPQGIYFGGNEMYLTPREMMKFGELYLDRGMMGGRRIIPVAWVDSSWVPRTVSPFNGHRYGYGWWQRTAAGRDVNFAWGYGGQYIFVVPALDVVVVMTSDAVSAREWGHNRELHTLLESIIAALPPGRS